MAALRRLRAEALTANQLAAQKKRAQQIAAASEAVQLERQPVLVQAAEEAEFQRRRDASVEAQRQRLQQQQSSESMNRSSRSKDRWAGLAISLAPNTTPGGDALRYSESRCRSRSGSLQKAFSVKGALVWRGGFRSQVSLPRRRSQSRSQNRTTNDGHHQDFSSTNQGAPTTGSGPRAPTNTSTTSGHDELPSSSSSSLLARSLHVGTATSVRGMVSTSMRHPAPAPTPVLLPPHRNSPFKSPLKSPLRGRSSSSRRSNSRGAATTTNDVSPRSGESANAGDGAAPGVRPNVNRTKARRPAWAARPPSVPPPLQPAPTSAASSSSLLPTPPPSSSSSSSLRVQSPRSAGTPTSPRVALARSLYGPTAAMAYAASMTGAATAAPVRAASAAAGKKSKKSPSTVNTNTPSMQDARAEAIERDSLSQRPPSRGRDSHARAVKAALSPSSSSSSSPRRQPGTPNSSTGAAAGSASGPAVSNFSTYQRTPSSGTNSSNGGGGGGASGGGRAAAAANGASLLSPQGSSLSPRSAFGPSSSSSSSGGGGGGNSPRSGSQSPRSLSPRSVRFHADVMVAQLPHSSQPLQTAQPPLSQSPRQLQPTSTFSPRQPQSSSAFSPRSSPGFSARPRAGSAPEMVTSPTNAMTSPLRRPSLQGIEPQQRRPSLQGRNPPQRRRSSVDLNGNDGSGNVKASDLIQLLSEM